NVQYTLSGNHDADDLSYTSLYFNATAPTTSGATYLGQTAANFAAPHAYSYYINKFMARGSSGYFIITANVNIAASDNKTVQVNGATNPVAFSYTTAPNITNAQTNTGGVQTIQAAEVTLTSSAVSAGNIVRGTSTNVVYIVKMDVSAMANVTMNNVQYTLSGTHDADDLTYTSLYFNTTPAITGATYLGQASATFAAPHTYSYYINKAMTRGTSGYFLVTVNVNAAGTLGNTVQLNGATNPLVFSYTTAPNVTNSQTNAAGVKTISAFAPAGLISSNTNSGDAAQSIVISSVYPNPVTDLLHVSVKGEAKLIVTTQDGIAVAQKTITDNGTIDMSKLKPGLYFIKDAKSGYAVSVMKK
ncbi:MAG TPA: T9SS type A sorting domain-containing protein, partial [Chitinophagaceae bacterium]|nr:T9SS type A sorting domain-containing protein [Chitinophagaceae bacterium]